MSVCVCTWFSKPLRLAVGVCVYTCIRLCASFYSLYMYVHNSTLCVLLLSLLSQAVFPFTISLSFPYAIHIFNVHVNKAKQGKANGSTQGRQLISKKKAELP